MALDLLQIAANIGSTFGGASLVAIGAAAIKIARSIARMERTIFGDAQAKQKGLIDRIITLEAQAMDWDRRRPRVEHEDADGRD